MKAIEFVRDKYPISKYPRMTDEVIKTNNCPNHILDSDNKPIIDMDFFDCSKFEFCEECWNQEIKNENTKQK